MEQIAEANHFFVERGMAACEHFGSLWKWVKYSVRY